jgi:hypothetical protein
LLLLLLLLLQAQADPDLLAGAPCCVAQSLLLCWLQAVTCQ